MDHHVDMAITRGLRLRGVMVLTAEEDGTKQLADPLLLDRAMALGYVLFTQDVDLLAEAVDGKQRAKHSPVLFLLVSGSCPSANVSRISN